MGDVKFTTFFGEEVRLSEETKIHINKHFTCYQEKAIHQALTSPLLVTYSHHTPGCELYFSFRAHPDFPEYYVKVVVNNSDSPAYIKTAMITDKPRQSELQGGIRYDGRI